MKKNVIFTVTLIITVLLVSGGIFLMFSFLQRPKEEYTINSFIKIENKNEALVNSSFELSDCLNEKNKVELKISAGTNERRPVKYELCFFVEYEQVPFNIENKEYISYLFDNDTDITVQFEEKLFSLKNNSFILLLRQDIEEYAENSELVRDTPPIVIRYSVMKKDGKAKEKKEEVIDITEGITDNGDDIVHLEDQMGNEAECYHAKKKENLKMSALLGSQMKTGNHIVFACFDSKQTMLNGQEKMLIRKKENGKINFIISAPEKKGKYEFQVFFVPFPFKKIQDENFAKYNVFCSQKQTIYVE